MKYYTNIYTHGNQILERYIEDGERKMRKVPYEPTLYVNSNKQTAYKTIHGKQVEPRPFDSIRDARDFIRDYGKTSNSPVYGMQQFAYAYINEEYPTRNFDMDGFNILNFDIETVSDDGFPNIAEANKAILSVAFRLTGDKSIVIATPGSGKYEPGPGIDFIECKDEVALLYKFIDIWVAFDPDIITGWNIELFDVPYVCNRIENRLSKDALKRLSPWGMVNSRLIPTPQTRQIEEQGGRAEPNAKDIIGVTVLDYLGLYRKFTYSQQESYSLDNIGFVELGEKKLDYSEYESLNELYKQNYQKFLDYNIKDVLLVERLDDKMKLIEQAVTIAQDAGVNIIDALTSVRMWDVIIHNFLMQKHIVVPPKVTGDKDGKVEGAYVKDPQVGMHDWVVSFDLNSLYPHLIMQYNISPETFVRDIGFKPTIDDIIEGLYNDADLKDFMNKHNVTACGSGAMYTKNTQGFLPKLMENMYNDRVVWKKRMIKAKKAYEKAPTDDLVKEIARCNNMQMAKKIQLNSAYGALGNQYFRFFDTKYAESITLSGQLSIKWMEKHINVYLNKLFKTEGEDYVLAVDTDSLYITLDRLVSAVMPTEKDVTKIVDFLDRVCEEKLEPFIDRSYADLGKYVNAYEQKMVMKREAIADRGIWTGKKHYILNVHDNEGVRYATPQLKMMGIEAVRSSTPSSCRIKIKEALKVIMQQSNEDLRDFVDDFEKEHRTLPYEEIAFPRGCRNLVKYSDAAQLYKKGTPIAVRGALVYNDQLRQKGLEKKVTMVYDGDKVKFCYMRLPNPTRSNIISVPASLDRRLGLHEYIDYEKQFDKGFKEPIRTICNAIGWELDKQYTLDQFFG
jgi:DNA polymerase elongation subunit (family B)|tara:strand:+ start:4399 stop:6936 length:2538 start_codon:yes stop_codon:yes gene_type:complete